MGQWGSLFSCMNSCMYARMYVYFCICMLVYMHVCKIVDLLSGNTYFLLVSKIFTEATNFTEAVASFASYVATTLPVTSVSVTTPAKNNMYYPWNLGRLNSSFFMI